MEGFPTIPRTVKSSDPTYRQLIEIGTQISLGSRTVISGPCCSFKPQEASSTFIKTPRPDPTSQCSRIASIKSHRWSSCRIKVNNLQPPSSDVLKLQQYFGDAELTSHSWGFQPKVKPRDLQQKVNQETKDPLQNCPFNLQPFSGATRHLKTRYWCLLNLTRLMITQWDVVVASWVPTLFTCYSIVCIHE